MMMIITDKLTSALKVLKMTENCLKITPIQNGCQLEKPKNVTALRNTLLEDCRQTMQDMCYIVGKSYGDLSENEMDCCKACAMTSQ